MMTFCNLVLADTSSLNESTGMGVLENDYVRAGVNKTSGTFGSGGNTSPGLLYDSTGTGDFNTSYDYLTPGTPFDGWSIKIDDTNTTNNNTGTASWTDSDGLSDGDGTLTWQGTNSSYSSWQVEHIYSLGATSQYIDITTNITAGSDASAVYFGRFIDPDARAASGDSSATDNVLGYSGIPDSNVSFSEATVSRYALGLYSTNTNVDAGISSGWTIQADGYTTSPYTDSDGNTVNYGTGDHTIGLTWSWTGVSAGDILTADYAYIFGPSAFDAADSAIDGGAGGGTAGETPSDWGTVSDVGSATDAASGASSGPTAIGTATSSITSHSASESDGVQTIARTRTTSTWTVYDDASTSDPTVSTESLSSFTGRVDQIETINNMMQLTNREVDFHGIKLLNDNSKASNGMAGDVVGVVVGGKRDLDNGWALGAGFGKLDARADNNSDWVEADSVMFNVHAERELVDGSVRLSLTNSNVDYSLRRVIGDFSNTASTTGVDRYARIQWTAGGEKLRPILGYTKGVTRVEGYTEAGSIQSARTVARDTDWYRFASVGFEFNLTPSLSGSYVHDTDGTNSLAVGLDKTINDKTLTLEFGRVETETTAANTINAKLNIMF
jgi:hypothetical protein